MQPPIHLHTGLGDCLCREWDRRRKHRDRMRSVRDVPKLAVVPKRDADELRIYPESAYDAQDWKAIPFLEQIEEHGFARPINTKGLPENV